MIESSENSWIVFAIQLATKAHDGQLRASTRGQKVPYTAHLHDVSGRIINFYEAAGMAKSRERNLAVGAGWLHDVQGSDTAYPVTSASMIAHGIPSEVIRVVELMNPPEGVTYNEHILEIAKYPVPTVVKLNDIISNMAAQPKITMLHRYATAVQVLARALDQHGYKWLGDYYEISQ